MSFIVMKCQDCVWKFHGFHEENAISHAENHMMETGHIVVEIDEIGSDKV